MAGRFPLLLEAVCYGLDTIGFHHNVRWNKGRHVNRNGRDHDACFDRRGWWHFDPRTDALIVFNFSEVFAMGNLFTAVDVTGVSGNIETLMIAFIGINLLFLGYRYVKKTMNRG